MQMAKINPLLFRNLSYELVRWLEGKYIAAKPEDLTLNPGTHMVEVENQLLSSDLHVRALVACHQPI